MRIEGWSIDGFGILRDMEIAGIEGGVTVFLGQNEAGKSTLLAFLRAMLFGFPDKRMRENLYPPLAGGRHGGRLTLREQDGLWTVTRFSDNRRSVAIGAPDGRPGNEDDLRRLLSGVDATLFRSVFAFSLDELQRFATLDAEGVRERIFSVGISGAGQSARAVLKQLAGQEALLLKQRAGQATINDIVRAIQRAEEDVRQAAHQAAGHADLARTEDDESRLVSEREAALTALAAARRAYEALCALRPDWEELAGAERLLAELPAPSDPDLPRAVRELMERLRVLRSRDEALGARQTDLATARADLQRHLQHLGAQWTAERLHAVDDSIVARDTVREWRRRLTDTLATANLLERDAQGARGDLAELTTDHEYCSLKLSPTPPPSSETLSDREARLRGLRTQLRDLQVAELRERPDDASQRRGWRLAAAGALLALVAALAAAAMGAAQLALGLGAGALLLGVVALLGRTGARRPAREDAGAPGVVTRLRSQVSQSGGALGLGDHLSDAELNALEARLTAERGERVACDGTEEQLHEMERKLATAATRLASLESVAVTARELAVREQTAWATWTTSRGLPEISPEGILELLEDVRQARAAHEVLARAQADIATITAERAAWNAGATIALAAAGHETTAGSAQIEAALATLDEALGERAAALDLSAVCQRRLRTGLSELPDPEEARRELTSGDPELWRAELARLAAETNVVNASRTHAIEARRDAQRAREALEGSTDVPRLQGELEALRAELAGAVHEYRVVTTAARLVRTTLQSYVRDRQPGVLERASAAFASVTAGRFRAIVQEAAEETDAIVVEQWNGVRVAPDDLSRGTCEQLYLAIRLALVGELADRGQELPLIMDDCLVNFDPARAAAMARLIAASAAGGQCLFFTCHPSIAELLRHASGDEARIVNLPGRGCGHAAEAPLPAR
jgi:uncharacterized protein YhaN